MKKKKCKRCGKYKNLKHFYHNTKVNKRDSHCSVCRKIVSKEYKEKNKEKLKEQNKIRYLKNRDRILQKNKEYLIRNKDKRKQYKKEYRKLNKEKINKERRNYISRKKRECEEFRIKANLRCRMSQFLKEFNKSESSMKLIGCSAEQLKKHLEDKFTEGMSWSNYGLKGWHIDHIKPCASFDLKDPQQQKECFHYSNLQPLWWYDNLSKADKL